MTQRWLLRAADARSRFGDRDRPGACRRGSRVDLRLVDHVRAAVPQLTLAVGGGMRGAQDLTRLADAGCDAALVATALHDGRIGAAEIASSAGLQACPGGLRGPHHF
jgi:phosphoribosylformimino-5-aminoimidazole carboxamide ribonucleotide (ProFAR) isomerase